jgi:hypothetical protein
MARDSNVLSAVATDPGSVASESTPQDQVATIGAQHEHLTKTDRKVALPVSVAHLTVLGIRHHMHCSFETGKRYRVTHARDQPDIGTKISMQFP